MTAAADSRRIAVAQAPDGALTYLVDMPPEAMPAVKLRDLAAAWDAAREAALAERWGAGRLLRFRTRDGGFMDLALTDADAGCWAGAVDAMAGMQTLAGMSLCLRLLALVDLLSTAGWARGLLRLQRDGAELDPALLQAAASLPLGPDARFDAAHIRAALANRLPAPAAAGTLPRRSAYGATA